jgi:hypothetical protein
MALTSRRGSFIMEHSVLGLVIVLVLLMMLGYLQRGMSGRWRDGMDSIGHGRQYEPRR